MAKYKKDKSRRLKENQRFIIPLNDGQTEDGKDSSITCVRVAFQAGDTYAFVKSELRATLKELGCNRAQSQRYIRTAFPEVFKNG